MKNKIISGFCIFLIVFSSFSVYVSADEIVAVSYDLDGDGVCDKSIDELKDVLGDKEPLTQRFLRCFPTERGDVCPDTLFGEWVDKKEDSETSGCSASQLGEFYNYWSVDLKEARPKRVRMNWLTDQMYGVDVFQPLELKKNIVAETEEGEIEIQHLGYSCYSFKTNELGQKERRVYLIRSLPRYPDPNDKKKLTFQFTVRRFSEQELSEENVLNMFNKRNIDGRDFEGIEIECKLQITSCRKKGNVCERLRGPPEVDEFEIFIPLERLVFHPPGEALERGAQLADNIIWTLDKIIPKLKDASEISENICYIGIGLLVLGNTLGRIPYLGWLKTIGDKFWDGVGHTDWFKNQKFGDKGLIGGKAFCRYYACPRQWCPFAESIKREGANVPVQDSIILSTRCGCLSGMYINLLKLKVILEEWRRCLEAARRSEQYVIYCEKYLSEYLCEHIITEFMTFKGESFLKKVLLKIPGVKTTVDKFKEALQAEEGAEATQGMVGGIAQVYEEIGPIGTGHVKGNLGYKEGTPQMICEYAFYRKLPEFDIFDRFKIDPLQWTTTVLGNWNSRVAYKGISEEDAVYEYTLSWTIIAGNDNFRYRLNLEREMGGTLPIRGHRSSVSNEKGDYIVDAGSDVLRNAGDLVADYIQVTSREEFDKLCFYMPSEVNEKQCFPPGSFDIGGPIGASIFAEKIQDSDEDGLADDWEERFNCMEGREDFQNDVDEQACKKLLEEGKNNILNPNNDDSDLDGMKDGRENPDDDAFTNYYEQQNNFHPNLPNSDEEGKATEASCYAQFGDNVGPTGEKISEKYRYDVGDNVNIVLSLGNDQRLTNREDLLLMWEIKNIEGGNLYYDTKAVKLNDPSVKENQAFKLMEIKDDIKTGVYLLRLSLVTQGTLDFKECTDPKDNKFVKKDFSLIIQDPNEEGCVDSDTGLEYDVEGVCIDSSSVNVDKCDGNTLTEWNCRDNRCVSEFKPCGDTGLCDEGKCRFDNCEDDDPTNNFGFPGACIFMKKGDNGEFKKKIYRDECAGEVLVQFSCVKGKCEATEGIYCPEGLVCKGSVCTS